MNGNTLAIWDFETLHDAVMEVEFGSEWYRKYPGIKQPDVVKVEKLYRSLEHTYETNWHDVLADWQYFHAYREELLSTPIRPVQTFSHEKGMKRLARYSASLFDREPFVKGLSNLIVVGITDDLIPLVQRANDAGLRVIGIGAPNQPCTDCEPLCEEFFWYDDAVSGMQAKVKSATEQQSIDTLAKAMFNLANRSGKEWIQRVHIKPAMVAVDPDFDEKLYGYASFSAFLDDHPNVLSHRHHYDRDEPEYKLKAKFRQLANAQLLPEEKAQRKTIAAYSRLAAEQGLRLPAPNTLWVGLEVYANLLANKQGFRNFSELDEECHRLLVKELPYATLTDSKKIRQVLFKCFLFSPGTGDRIGFREEVKTVQDIETLYFDLIIDRIVANTPEPVDYDALSIAVTGNADQADRLAARSTYHQQLDK
ncbi:hypothetical protein [Lewinella sp. 4G2]|uniref:hypothetical protein n=1 Tax=Lewinella sp. 4G2 TaxID=1803372 RepID=UPI0007B4F4C9|nr:hypothetical protein [Lewinella sp. 4G2]OAV45451.1 hypothetical protein A3850_013550 [Lewinella sp. 4G2]